MTRPRFKAIAGSRLCLHTRLSPRLFSASPELTWGLRTGVTDGGAAAAGGVLGPRLRRLQKGTYEKLRAKGVEFLGEPKEQPYGVEVGFKDLYGNIYYIIESRDAQPLEKKAVMAEA